MSGYRADLDAIGAASAVLRRTVDTVSAAEVGLDPADCASLGPGRLGTLASAMTEDAGVELRAALAAIGTDAELVDAAGRGYAEHDQETADLLTRRAGGED